MASHARSEEERQRPCPKHEILLLQGQGGRDANTCSGRAHPFIVLPCPVMFAPPFLLCKGKTIGCTSKHAPRVCPWMKVRHTHTHSDSGLGVWVSRTDEELHREITTTNKPRMFASFRGPSGRVLTFQKQLSSPPEDEGKGKVFSEAKRYKAPPRSFHSLVAHGPHQGGQQIRITFPQKNKRTTILLCAATVFWAYLAEPYMPYSEHLLLVQLPPSNGSRDTEASGLHTNIRQEQPSKVHHVKNSHPKYPTSAAVKSFVAFSARRMILCAGLTHHDVGVTRR